MIPIWLLSGHIQHLERTFKEIIVTPEFRHCGSDAAWRGHLKPLWYNSEVN